MADYLGSVQSRLGRNVYEVDEGNSHITVNQEIAKATGTGKLLVRVCPAHVYSEEPDGTISVEFAACLECGTCLAAGGPRGSDLALSPGIHGSHVPRRLEAPPIGR